MTSLERDSDNRRQSWVVIVLNLSVHVLMCKLMSVLVEDRWSQLLCRLLLLCYRWRRKDLGTLLMIGAPCFYSLAMTVEKVPYYHANHSIRNRPLRGLLRE
jgi:hypothetical protein